MHGLDSRTRTTMSATIKIFLFAVTLIGFTTAVPRGTQRIVGGSPASIQQYPFLSSLQYSWASTWWVQYCGGSLLTSVVVLSAGHCFYGDLAYQWRVQLGSIYAETGGSHHYISEIRIHEGFHPSHLDRDLAILRLSNNAVFGINVATAQIASPTYILPDNTPVSAVGWGHLRHGGPSSETLQHVQIFTINWELCRQRYKYLKTHPDYINYPDVTNYMSCTGVLGRGNHDVCQGDTGGPIVHNNNVVYGVASWGYQCGHEYYHSVNTFIPEHTTWILEHA